MFYCTDTVSFLYLEVSLTYDHLKIRRLKEKDVILAEDFNDNIIGNQSTGSICVQSTQGSY